MCVLRVRFQHFRYNELEMAYLICSVFVLLAGMVFQSGMLGVDSVVHAVLTYGVVVSIQTYGLIVAFANDLKGLLPRNQLTSRPLDPVKHGQVPGGQSAALAAHRHDEPAIHFANRIVR